MNLPLLLAGLASWLLVTVMTGTAGATAGEYVAELVGDKQGNVAGVALACGDLGDRTKDCLEGAARALIEEYFEGGLYIGPPAMLEEIELTLAAAQGCASRGRAGDCCGKGPSADVGYPTSRGGVYRLLDPDTGEVMRTFRSSDLASRRRGHARGESNKGTVGLIFEVVYYSNDADIRRGLEQMLDDQYPDAPLNKARTVSPRNKKGPRYRQAAEEFLASLC